MTNTSKPHVKENIIEEIVGQELFLYDGSRDVAYCTNSGAALIWYLCDGTRDLPAIATEISSSFALSADEVLEEVRQTVQQFEEMGLLIES